MEILQKAAEVFKNGGFHMTRMEDISSELMMTKGSLYHYFKNKEEILFLCHDYSLDVAINLLQEVIASGDSPDIKLKKLLNNHARMIMTEPTALVVATELEPLTGEFRQKVFEKRRAFEAGLRQILAEGIAKGVFCDHNPKILGFIILGALNWITKWYSPQGEMDVESLANLISEALPRMVSRKHLNMEMLRKGLEKFGSELQEYLYTNIQ
jgi:AcrR family transcriptional regulator